MRRYEHIKIIKDNFCQLSMATGAHGNPGASAAGAVEVVVQGALIEAVTVPRQDQEAGSAVGRQPREKTATEEVVQVGIVGMYDHAKLFRKEI